LTNNNSSHDSSGVILEIGSSIQGLKVGDRVAVLGPQHVSTTLNCAGDTVQRIPDNLSLEDAATMPLAHATAIHCLEHISCIRPGQTILITSACSDVGLATIQVSKTLGAEVNYVSLSIYAADL
jgi:NADPH:quinone reductase-like Zn-dependent oxidoreductase